LRDALEQFAGCRSFHGELSPKLANLQKVDRPLRGR
jgi:hypothetical protein